MGSGCLKVTKYFLFLFNLLFFILGAVILGFGIWIMVDKNSFIYVLQTSSSSLKTGAYILIGVGAVTMLMGFLGCLGAVNEIRCLLGLYFTCLFLILIGQIAAGLFIYFHQNARFPHEHNQYLIYISEEELINLKTVPKYWTDIH